MSITYGLLCFIILRLTFCTIFCVVASQKKSFLALRKWKMVFVKIICSHNLATLFPIQSYIYVSYMGTLSQTMVCEWPYLGHLAWNLYMFIDDRPFCEFFFWKVCENSCLIFILQTSTHEGTPCQRISFFEDFFAFLIFFKQMSKWPPWKFIERGRIFENYRWSCDIITTCVP